MCNFKIGDRVKLKDGVRVGIGRITTDDFSGIGTIKSIDSPTRVGVCFDEYMNGHNLNWSCNNGHGWHIFCDSLMLIQEEYSGVKIEDLL